MTRVEPAHLGEPVVGNAVPHNAVSAFPVLPGPLVDRWSTRRRSPCHVPPCRWSRTNRAPRVTSAGLHHAVQAVRR